MQVGELVEYKGHTWRVYRTDRQVRTATLIRWDGVQEEIENDNEEAKVVANPSRSWPFVAAPVRSSRVGRIVKLTRVVRNRPQELIPYVDWVPSDPLRAGGSIFLNPELKFCIGEVLSAEHQDGSLSRISITKSFGTLSQRRKRAEKPKIPQRLNRLQNIYDDDDDL